MAGHILGSAKENPVVANSAEVDEHNNCPARFGSFPLVWSLIPCSLVPCGSDLGSV
jgi:hypothetical protein